MKHSKYYSICIIALLILSSEIIKTNILIQNYVEKQEKVPNSAADFEVAVEVGDILTYNYSMGEEQYYQKLNVTEISENSTHLFISYNFSQTDDPTSFNSTHINQSTSILSGNVVQDLFSNITFFSTVLPRDANFSSQMSDFDTMFAGIGEDDNFKLEIVPSSDGLSISLFFYYRIVIFFLVMSMRAYYSTDRILLLYEMQMRDPTTAEKANMTLSILPEYSSPPSASENPYNPLYIPLENATTNTSTTVENVTTNTSTPGEDESDSTPQSIIFDWKSRLIITGVIAVIVGSGFGIRKIVQFRRKRKQNLSVI
ncbi:MAG: hypothetical protein ACTSYI_11765 [Promethearchaeota archaeon]